MNALHLLDEETDAYESSALFKVTKLVRGKGWTLTCAAVPPVL